MPKDPPPLYTERELRRLGIETFLTVLGIGLVFGLITFLVVGARH